MHSPATAPLYHGLLADLAWNRQHILAAVDGLDPESLGRSYVPSGWSPLNLVRHLTIDVERLWFCGAMTGDPEVVQAAQQGLSGWHDPEPLSAAEIMAGYRAACQTSDKIVADLRADTPARWLPYPGAPAELTAVLLHVVVETACHAGHLDIIRENLDARQFLVVD